METKQDKFDRLIEGRVEKAELALRRLGQLFEKRNYEWSDSRPNRLLTISSDGSTRSERKLASTEPTAPPKGGASYCTSTTVYSSLLRL